MMTYTVPQKAFFLTLKEEQKDGFLQAKMLEDYYKYEHLDDEDLTVALTRDMTIAVPKKLAKEARNHLKSKLKNDSPLLQYVRSLNNKSLTPVTEVSVSDMINNLSSDETIPTVMTSRRAIMGS